jgi:NAD(P)-dependent dehydrogenase (short-subunit alcohol dehydrogenase family)
VTSGRTAIVTGAARGIGAATVLRLASGGWNLMALDRCPDDPRLPYRLGTEQELIDVVAQASTLAGGGGAVESIVGDAGSSEATIEWLVDSAPDALTGATVPVDGGLSL